MTLDEMLAKLNYVEAEVLYTRVKFPDSKLDKLWDDLNISEPTFHARQSKALKKIYESNDDAGKLFKRFDLEFGPELAAIKGSNELKKRLSAALKMYPPEKPIDDLGNTRPMNPMSRNTPPTPPSQPPQTPPPAPPTPVAGQTPTEPPREPSRPSNIIGYVIGVLLACILCVVAVGAAALWFRPLSPISSVQNTQPARVETVIVLATEEVASEPEPTSGRGEVGTGATDVPPGDTDVPQPTRTSAPISNPRQTLFEDGFDQGLLPSWTLLGSDPSVVNGQLTSSEGTWLAVGDSSWVDYTVSFETSTRYCWVDERTSVIGVHATDQNNMVAFAWGNCEYVWFVVKNGEWTEVPNSRVRSAESSATRISFSVKGNRYEVSYKGLSSVVDSTFIAGGVALYVGLESTFDNFKVTSP